MEQKEKRGRRLTLMASALLALGAGGSAAAQQGGEARPFELGAVVVTGTLDQVGEIGKEQVASVIGRKEMRQFNRDNVGDALNLLSSDFRPTATEDGGARNNAYRRDSKVSLKLGVTPRAGDEYALSYYQQHGAKGQPPSTDPVTARYWQWPYWDKENLYFISRTALGGGAVLKVWAYHDNYGNEVDSYTNGGYTTLKTAGAGSLGTGRSMDIRSGPRHVKWLQSIEVRKIAE